MNSEKHRDYNFIYVTPYIDEVERVCSSVTTREIVQPEATSGRVKGEHLLELVRAKKSIVTTHKLFMDMNDKIASAIFDNNYILILDEVINVVEQVNIQKADLQDILLDSGILTCDSDGKASWSDKVYSGNDKGRFSDIAYYAKSGNLSVLGNDALIWEFPSQIFSMFEQCFILTYMFRGQLQRMYFDLNDIEYEYRSVRKNASGEYSLVEYHSEELMQIKKSMADLINLYDGKIHEGLSYTRLTGGKRSKALINGLATTTNSILKNQFRAVPKDTIVCIFSDTLINGGFKMERYVARTDDMLRIQPLRKNQANTYVSVSARATNNFADRHNVAYLVQRNLNPKYVQYFRERGVQITQMDMDIYTLSEAIQVIWRSAIRNSEPINLYIADSRVRVIFQKWLNEDIYEFHMGYDLISREEAIIR